MFLFDDAAQSLTTAVRNLEPLIYYCASSTVEYADVALFYVTTFEQPLKLVYNMIYDMGEIFDNTSALVDLSKQFNTMNIEQVKEFGTALGRLFNMLFYDPEDFETYEESISKIKSSRQMRRASK